MTPAPAHGDGPTGPSAPTGRTEPPRDRRHALIFNAITRGLAEADRFVALSEREAIARRVGEVLTDAVLPVVEAETAALRTALKDAERERDLAIAHDRQPYPTAWAYEQACKALETHRQRAEQAERERDQARDAIADERRGRLAAEAAVRRARELARNRIAVPTDVLREALTIEQPEETPHG